MTNSDHAGRERKSLTFRRQAVRAAGFRIFGTVTVHAPPTAGIAVLLATIALASLILAMVLVEVSERTTAIGVLMPAGGLATVRAETEARVTAVFVSPGTRVNAGDELFALKSGAGSLAGSPIPGFTLASLRRELELRRNAFFLRHRDTVDQIAAVEQSLQAAISLHQLGQGQFEFQRQRESAAEQRLVRREQLVREGHISQEAFAEAQSAMLEQSIEIGQARQTVATLAENVRQLEQKLNALQQSLAQVRAEFAISREGLLREIAKLEHFDDGRYRAPVDGVVAHLLADVGSIVRRGDVLAKVRPAHADTEAWMYVATGDARELAPGQTVEIELTAFPAQIFSTITASIESVSSIALLPGEVQVPVPLPGPVFEVRALFEQSAIAHISPDRSGQSFTADIVRRRYKLYQWLLRSIRGTGSRLSDAGRV